MVNYSRRRGVRTPAKVGEESKKRPSFNSDAVSEFHVMCYHMWVLLREKIHGSAP